jgi:dihydrodipicolinate synthase/N-acetylneuraminate lyase
MPCAPEAQETDMTASIFSGTIPALMTPCKPDCTPDVAMLAKEGRRLCDAGMSAVVYCGSMGDWPLLTDEQRMEGIEALVKAGVPVIVGTGAQNPARAAALAAHAKKVGAHGLMVIPRVLSRGQSPAAQEAHFAGILEAAVDLPAVIYNSPITASRQRLNSSSGSTRVSRTFSGSRNSAAPPRSRMRPRRSRGATRPSR